MKFICLEPPGCVAVMPYEEKKQASGLLSRLGHVCHRKNRCFFLIMVKRVFSHAWHVGAVGVGHSHPVGADEN
jgi:hypothetical protein